MSSALQNEPAHAVRHTAQVIPLRPNHSVANERVAALMCAMETHPWRAPEILSHVGPDQVWRVRVETGGQVALLTPDEARLCAAAVFAENALPGSGEVSARLRESADECDAGAPSGAPAHGFTGLGGLIGFAGMGLMVLAVLLNGRG